ncbi:MAG TPA: LysM peptidoglycan-binding domain-containing protein [Mariprofundaceae bacterium]|nr:LysM peptidoglycan-binding domain-containing protein [Mariprofundaceae bacterium]
MVFGTPTGRMTAYLCALMLAAGCAPVVKQTESDKPAAKDSSQTASLGNGTEQQSLRINQPDPLLDGLLPDDLAKAQAQAKQNYLKYWPYISGKSRYVRYRMLAELAQLQAPQSLEAVPIVESGYNPYALSHAGAMGLWQLMPTTAHFLGIRKSSDIDGRRHVESSSEAAVRYLQSLHDRFGNWPLALAAYNYGPNAVARRLQKTPWQPADGLDQMPVPAVTRDYVRDIIGLAALLHMGVLCFPDPLPTRAITVESPIDLKQLASVSDLGVEEFFRFNPGLNHAQYLNEPVTIHVPDDKAASVISAQETCGPQFVSTTVRDGDSLWTIARRHHIDVAYLRRLNPGISKVLHVGQPLKVPANALAQAIATPNPLLSQGRRIQYKVRSGDSLWKIAERFGTTPQAIARSNEMSTDATLRPGDRLWILARIRPI